MNSLAQQKLNEIKKILDDSGLIIPDKKEIFQELSKEYAQNDSDKNYADAWGGAGNKGTEQAGQSQGQPQGNKPEQQPAEGKKSK